MSLAVKPMGCNGGCRSCYEATIRNCKGFEEIPNYKAVAETLKREISKDAKGSWKTPCLHGGEPLLMPLDAIEEFLSIIFAKYGRTSIQTNGILINGFHIDLFKKFKTNIGISIDGDTAEMNLGRWNAGEWNVKAMTMRVLDNMTILKDAGVPIHVLAVLRKCNASPRMIPELIRFLARMKGEFGVKNVRLNPAVVYRPEWADEEELTNGELAYALRILCDLQIEDPEVDWRPMKDLINALSGRKDNVCWMGNCDVWCTNSETPIYLDGTLGNCLHGGAAIDGVMPMRTERPGYERAEMLQQIDQDDGGCKGCFFWRFCHGGCPGSGIGNDWRNRSRFCGAYVETFRYLMKQPIFKGDPKGEKYAGDYGDREHGDSNDPEWRKKHPEWKGGK
jgi:uncharacterized protein